MSKKIQWKALDIKVIAVAVEGAIKDWSAYIGSVEGNDHKNEWMEVRRNGTKLPKKVAELIFPEFKRLKWRY